MAVMKLQQLKGTRPKITPTMLPEGFTQVNTGETFGAENCDFDGNLVEPMPGLSSQEVLSDNFNDVASTPPTLVVPPALMRAR